MKKQKRETNESKNFLFFATAAKAASANHHLTFSTPHNNNVGFFLCAEKKGKFSRHRARVREEIRICICDGDSSNMCAELRWHSVGGFLLKF